MLKLTISLCLIIIFWQRDSPRGCSLIIKFWSFQDKVHQYHIGATKLAEAVERNSGER
jgi:hypothetical protein